MIYLQLFLEFFKVGLFCFGGAFGMIPLIEETVVTRGWLTESEFFNLIGVCESTPGPIAVNTATYVGSVMGGPMGSIVATLGVVLPSFLIILLIAAVLKNLTDNKYFKGFMRIVALNRCALKQKSVDKIQNRGYNNRKAILYPITASQRR